MIIMLWRCVPVAIVDARRHVISYVTQLPRRCKLTTGSQSFVCTMDSFTASAGCSALLMTQPWPPEATLLRAPVLEQASTSPAVCMHVKPSYWKQKISCSRGWLPTF